MNSLSSSSKWERRERKENKGERERKENKGEREERERERGKRGKETMIVSLGLD